MGKLSVNLNFIAFIRSCYLRTTRFGLALFDRRLCSQRPRSNGAAVGGAAADRGIEPLGLPLTVPLTETMVRNP